MRVWGVGGWSGDLAGNRLFCDRGYKVGWQGIGRDFSYRRFRKIYIFDF